jgi:hypothetical protein
MGVQLMKGPGHVCCRIIIAVLTVSERVGDVLISWYIHPQGSKTPQLESSWLSFVCDGQEIDMEGKRRLQLINGIPVKMIIIYMSWNYYIDPVRMQTDAELQ